MLTGARAGGRGRLRPRGVAVVPDPLVWAPITSGIYPLENGHRVVTFSSPPDLFTVHEADEAGERVWRLFGDNLSYNFRSVPWPSMAGEERVDGMP